MHISTNIKGLLSRCSDKMLSKLFLMNGSEARRKLQELSDKGDLLIPSDNCNHFDSKEGCQCIHYKEGFDKDVPYKFSMGGGFIIRYNLSIDKWDLFEIPLHGGEEQFSGSFVNPDLAKRHADTLL